MITLTLPGQLVANARRFDAKSIAIRHKRLGIWQALTWGEVAREVEALALGFAAAGLARGETVLLLGENRPASYLVHLAVQSVGGIAAPLPPDGTAPEVIARAAECGAIGLFCLGQESVEIGLEVLAARPDLRWLVHDDERGLAKSTADRVSSLRSIRESGRPAAAADPGAFERFIAAGQPDDPATLVYTGGATCGPRPIRLSHRNLLAAATGLATSEDIGPTDRVLAFLPIGSIADVAFSLALPLATGCTLNCPESAETVRQNLREIGPTILYAPPQIWRLILVETLGRLEGAAGLPGRFFRWAFRQAAATGREDRLSDWLIFAPLRDQLGLSRVRRAYSGGALTGRAILDFYRGIGLTVRPAYVLTEAAGVAAIAPATAPAPDELGLPIAGVEFSVAPAGELLVQGESIAGSGANDWLATGDRGEPTEAGHWRFLDRIGDFGQLTDGTAFRPALIEAELMAGPYLGQAIVFAGRFGVAAAIGLDAESVTRWTQARDLKAGSFEQLALLEPVADLVKAELARINQHLPAACRIQRFLILPEELPPGSEIVTWNGRIRRASFAKRFPTVEVALGDDRPTVALTIRRAPGQTDDLTVPIWTVQSAARPADHPVIA